MPWIRRLVAVISLFSLVGCSDGAGSLDTGGSTTCYAGNEAYLQAKINGITAKISAIRGLSYQQSVTGSWVLRSHLLALEDSLASAAVAARKMSSSDTAVSSEDVYLALGYTSSLGSASTASDSLYGSGTEAFYEDGTNHLWVVTDQACNSDLNETVAHELEHALQDQNFGLTYNSDTMETDQVEARTMVVEGDAVYVANLYDLLINGYPTSTSTWEQYFRGYDLPNTVRWLDTSIYAGIDYVATIPGLMPYEWGPAFIHQMRVAESGGWDKVNAYFKRYPTTTTQVLHPQLRHQGFADWDSASVFTSMKTWTNYLGNGRLGELYLATLLYTWGYPSFAPSPVQGWYGDRFWIWRNDASHHAAAGRVAFSTPDSAKSFLTAWKTYFPKHYTSGTASSGDSTFAYTTTDSSFSGKALLRSDTVLVAWGNLGGSSLDSLWKDLTGKGNSYTVAARQLGKVKHFRLKPIHLPPPHHPFDIGLH